MTKYKIKVVATEEGITEIEANTKQEALELAVDQYEYNNIDELDVNVRYEIIDEQ